MFFSWDSEGEENNDLNDLKIVCQYVTYNILYVILKIYH